MIEEIFGDIDFKCINDPEYKEDSVREDIIAPLLKKIGYSSTGNNKIVRSRALVHPYVMFGSKKKNINIIPDYILEVDGNTCFVLDAKSPKENILNGNNVAQVYSYAIHPEVRARNYGLCNGKLLALFEVTDIRPKRIYDLPNLSSSDILDINQKLNPRTIKDSNILDYDLDAGIFMHMVLDIQLHQTLYFNDVLIPMLAKLSSNSYSINVITTSMADRDLLMTFDFKQEQFDKLMQQIPASYRSEIEDRLSKQPFFYKNNKNPPSTNIKCRLSEKPEFSKKGEMFFPLLVEDFIAGN
jgi:hypothetical protein